ncbi:MAG: YcxB family protein [Deltaproteobacteria bacterium]|nr:YcxB family protein [Deltaproteobacteria bacterium]
MPDDADGIVLAFEYAPGEWVRLTRRFRFRFLSVARDLVVTVLMVALTLFAPAQWRVALLAACAGYAAIACASVLVWPVWWERRIPYLRERYRLELGHDALAFSTASVSSRLPWSYYRGWARDRQALYLWMGRGQATVIRSRALVSNEAAVLDRLRSKLGEPRWSA